MRERRTGGAETSPAPYSLVNFPAPSSAVLRSGLFVSVALSEGTDEAALLETARKRGVAVDAHTSPRAQDARRRIENSPTVWRAGGVY